MTRQVTDQLYIEIDYFTPEEYFIYTAEAVCAQTATATMAVSGDKIVEAQSTMSAAFTQTASITHIEGVDLFAFSDAALSAEVSRLRETNISVSSVFNAAIDISRIVQVNADESAVFSFTTTVVRSRDAESALSAAFSLSGDAIRIQSSSASLDVSSSLSATISHIEGADLTAFTNAALTADVNVLRSAVSTQSATATITASLSGTINGGAAFSATTALSASVRVNIRTTTLTEVGGSGYVTAAIDTSIKKWGAGSLKWTFPSAEPTPTSNIVWTGSAFKAFSNGYTWTSSDGTTWTRATNDLTGYDGYWDITYANSNFIAYDSTNGKYKYSSNGTAWSDTTLTIPGGGLGSFTTNKREVYYIGGYYHVFGCQIIGTTHTLVSYRSTSLTGSWARYDISNLIGDANLNGSSGLLDVKLVGSTAYLTVTFYDNYSSVYSRGTRFTGSVNPSGGWNILSANTGHLFAQNSSWDGGDDYLAYVVDFDDSSKYLYWKNVSTTGSYAFSHTVNDITYANGVWFIATADGLYKTTAVNTEPTLVDTDIESAVQYQSSKYIARSNTYAGYVRTSTDAATWTYADIDPQILPGSLTYSRGDNSDIGGFKTLDFWYYNTSSEAGRRFAFEQSSTRYISFGTSSNNYLEIQNVNGASSSNLSITETSVLPFNTWTHIRLSIDGSNASLYVGGTRKATTSSWLGGVTAPLKIGGATLPAPVQYAAQFDEIYITDQLITSPSATSFSVPTGPWNNSSTDVDLLLHFNTDFADDTAFFVDPSATLTATASLTATLTGTKEFTASPASQFTLSVVIGKVNEIVLEAFADAALTTNITKFTGYESSQSAAFTISVDNTRTRDSASSQSSEFTQALTFERFRTASSSMASEFAQSTTAVKTTDILSTNSSEFTQVSNTIKTAEAVLSISSAFTPVINILATKNGEIILQTAATLTADSTRTRDITASISGTATLTAVVSRTQELNANLASEFAISASPTGTIYVSASLASEFTQTTEVRRNRFGAAEFSSVFQQYTNTQDSLARQASASLSVSTALSADNIRIRFAEVATEAIFSELVATAVTAEGTIALSATAQMSITATRTRGISSAIAATAALSVPGERILASAVVAVDSAAALTAEGTTNITAEADLAVNTTLTALAQRGRDILLVAFSDAALTTTIKRTRTTGSTMSATAQMSVATTKLVGSSAALVSTTSVSAVGTKQIGIIANLVASGGLMVIGKIIKVDTYVYVIPSETRIHIINSETRKYAISSETRKYTIRRA